MITTAAAIVLASILLAITIGIAIIGVIKLVKYTKDNL